METGFTLRSETPVVFRQRNKGMISFCLCFTKVALAAGWKIKDRKGRVSEGRETRLQCSNPEMMVMVPAVVKGVRHYFEGRVAQIWKLSPSR